MRIAFSKPTSTTQEKRNLFGNFRTFGYDGLQLKGSQYASYVDDPAKFLESWPDTGIVSGLITGGSLDAAGLAQLKATIAFAKAVGSERLIFCHGVPRAEVTEADIVGFARTLSKVGREASDQGVVLSLHHHYDQPVMHRRDFDTFFEAADPDAVRLTVDTAHLAKSGVSDITGLAADFASVIDNFHLKDFADGEFRLLGEGTLDLDGLFAQLATAEYDGWLCVDEETDADLVDAMRRSIEYLHSKLDRRR